VGQPFFEETITAKNYPNIFTQFSAMLEKNKQDCWFQHAGATAHTAKTAAAFLQNFFGDHIVGHGPLGTTIPRPYATLLLSAGIT
jgi:hypothetical protein